MGVRGRRDAGKLTVLGEALAHGRIVGRGPFDALAAAGGPFARLVAAQAPARAAHGAVETP